MLINFTFQNYRSFRDERTLSLEAGSVRELPECVVRRGGYALLPAAALYGANSSGKSNVISALATMRSVVRGSVKLNPEDPLDYEPFRLDLDSSGKPTSFEIQFLLDGVRYRYGFTYDRVRICQEWLYEKRPGEREYSLFLRAGDKYEISKTRFREGLGKTEATQANRLFISLVAQLKGEKSAAVLRWFGGCNCLSGLTAHGYEGFTWKMFREHRDGSREALDFFHRLQLGFNDLLVTERPFTEEMASSLPFGTEQQKKHLLEQFRNRLVTEVKTTHNVYDANGKVVRQEAFDKDEMESGGTKKVIELSGPVFDTLLRGGVLAVDELDAKLHPLMTRAVVQLFMNPETNSKGAQLLFATHDTNLLSLSCLRRDQIWFTEKDATESTDLYSLLEFRDPRGKKVRRDSSVQKDYIEGRYGAIPFIR